MQFLRVPQPAAARLPRLPTGVQRHAHPVVAAVPRRRSSVRAGQQELSSSGSPRQQEPGSRTLVRWPSLLEGAKTAWPCVRLHVSDAAFSRRPCSLQRRTQPRTLPHCFVRSCWASASGPCSRLFTCSPRLTLELELRANQTYQLRQLTQAMACCRLQAWCRRWGHTSCHSCPRSCLSGATSCSSP